MESVSIFRRLSVKPQDMKLKLHEKFYKLKVKNFAVICTCLIAIIGILQLIETLLHFIYAEYCDMCETYNFFSLIPLIIWIGLIVSASVALYAMYKPRPRFLIPYLTLFSMFLFLLLVLIPVAIVGTIFDIGLEDWIFFNEDKRRYSERSMWDVWFTLIILLVIVLFNIYFILGAFCEDSLLKDAMPSIVPEHNLEPDIGVVDTQSLQSWKTSISWMYIMR